MSPVKTEAPTNPFGQDTCDHCGPGVLAYVWASKGDQELTYCGHCGTEYKVKLAEWADIVHDLTYIAMGK